MPFLLGVLKSPYFALTLVPLIWGTNFIVGKQLVQTFPPFTLTTGRFMIALLSLLPVFLYYQRKEALSTTENKPDKMKFKTWSLLIFLGFAGIFAFNTLIYAGLRQTSPVNATLINAFNPSLTVLLSMCFLGEKLRGKQIVGLILSFIGVAWMAVQGQPDRLGDLAFNQGDLLIICGAFVWAGYSIGVKKVVSGVSPLFTTTLSIFFGLLLLFPATYVELRYQSVGLLTWKNILSLVYLGVFPSVVAFWLWNRGIAQVGPGKASMFYNLIPLFTAIMSYLFLAEIPRDYHLIGGALILWGVVWGAKW